MQLRPYQEDAVVAAKEWLKKSIEPCVLELATGAGKSWIIAALAGWINSTSGKHVLCLAPSAELVSQNSEKYQSTGQKCSIFSASLGSKCLRYPVVYATEKSVKNKIKPLGLFLFRVLFLTSFDFMLPIVCLGLKWFVEFTKAMKRKESKS